MCSDFGFCLASQYWYSARPAEVNWGYQVCNGNPAICWEVCVQTSSAPNGTISSSCRGNTISLFRPLILLNHCSKETEVNSKHANSILNTGNKDIGQIYLLEHSVVGNMLSFGCSVNWPGIWHPHLGRDALERRSNFVVYVMQKGNIIWNLG